MLNLKSFNPFFSKRTTNIPNTKLKHPIIKKISQN